MTSFNLKYFLKCSPPIPYIGAISNMGGDNHSVYNKYCPHFTDEENKAPGT
jgi:hypothetical protein